MEVFLLADAFLYDEWDGLRPNVRKSSLEGTLSAGDFFTWILEAIYISIWLQV